MPDREDTRRALLALAACYVRTRGRKATGGLCYADAIGTVVDVQAATGAFVPGLTRFLRQSAGRYVLGVESVEEDLDELRRMRLEHIETSGDTANDTEDTL